MWGNLGKECGLVERAQVVKSDSPGVANDQLGYLTEFLTMRIKNNACEWPPGKCMSCRGGIVVLNSSLSMYQL